MYTGGKYRGGKVFFKILDWGSQCCKKPLRPLQFSFLFLDLIAFLFTSFFFNFTEGVLFYTHLSPYLTPSVHFIRFKLKVSRSSHQQSINNDKLPSATIADDKWLRFLEKILQKDNLWNAKWHSSDFHGEDHFCGSWRIPIVYSVCTHFRGEHRGRGRGRVNLDLLWYFFWKMQQNGKYRDPWSKVLLKPLTPSPRYSTRVLYSIFYSDISSNSDLQLMTNRCLSEALNSWNSICGIYIKINCCCCWKEFHLEKS